MEDNSQRKNKFQQFYGQLRQSFFNIMFELLKEKNTGIVLGCFIMLVMFLQIIGLLFDPNRFEWKDPFFLSFIYEVCAYCRVIKAIEQNNSLFFYWAFMLFGIFYIITLSVLLIYMNYFLKNRKHYVEAVVKLLRIMILLLYWIFYMPFFETFLSILNCHGGYHYLDTSLQCFQGVHIFYFVVCIIFLVLLFVISLITAMLYNETQPVQEDCLSRLESSFEVRLVIYRSVVSTESIFCNSEVCSWILISIFIISSAIICYSYYKQIPYYNPFISIFCGSIFFIYLWVSVNALLMKLLKVDGHIIIIFVGIPIITLLVKNLREKRIETLMKTNIDKLKLDIDALIQVHNMTDFSKGVQKDQTQRMTMIGIVNLHIIECQNAECPCKDEYEMYDITSGAFQERNRQAPHLDEVFLNHFVKRLYEDALNKFINSPSIHIAFAYYLFKVMKNIHASLLELNIAIKKKPSMQQQFTIFRYKNIIEDYIKQDNIEHKYIYPELTNVIEFERLFGEMQKAIEKVCNLQVEFWTHLTTVVPDLNILNDLGKKIYSASQESDFFWAQLCKINPNYKAALEMYGEYLKEIRNHEHLGNSYIERFYNSMSTKKSIDEHTKTSDVLFSDDTTVIHVSGNKESIGKILKTSQGLSKVFGYSKTEVIGHSVNILMPTLFAKRHADFMERFFRTSRQVIFYQERSLFATHRNGHCFQMKLLVKQMPSLSEGIQYVGMIKPVASDYEYMLTDMDGIIDSFSKGITGLLGLTPNLFKDKDTQINIQILAPELISFFMETQQRGRAAKSKYREPGGDTITLIVPRDFHIIAKAEAKNNPRAGGRNRGNRNQVNNNRNRSAVFKQFLKALNKPKKVTKDKMPTTKLLMQQPEYVNCDRKKEVPCEITPLEIKAGNNEYCKMLIFKFSKNEKADKKKGDDIEQYLLGYRGGVQDDVNQQNTYQEFQQETQDINASEQRKPIEYYEESLVMAVGNNNNNYNNYNNNQNQEKQQEKKVQFGIQDNKVQQISETALLLAPGDDQAIALVTPQGRRDEEQSVQQQSSKKSSSSKKDDRSSAQKNEGSQAVAADLVTPRQDIGLVKMNSAQKEKEQMMDQIKKQSVIISEHSTEKKKDIMSLNVSENLKLEKKSFENDQLKDAGNKQSSRASQKSNNILKNTKKKNYNNMRIGMGGDDSPSMEEEDDDADDESNSKKQSSKKSNSQESSQKSENDSQEQSEEEDDDKSISSGSGKKKDRESSSKKGGNDKKNSNNKGNYDSDENEDDYSDSKGSKGHVGEKLPLLNAVTQLQPQSTLIQQQQSIPHVQDFKLGFEEVMGSKNSHKNSEHHSQRFGPGGNQQHSLYDGSPQKSQFQSGAYQSKMGTGNGLKFQMKKMMSVIKRDTSKIKTNPKYKCVDEGSEDENVVQQNDDPQQLSSKELDFRETVLKFEKRRRRKERKQKEKEIKKIKALNGEEANEAVTRGGEGGAKTPVGPDDEVDSSSSSSSSEDTKDARTAGGTPMSASAANNKKLQQHQKHSQNDEGEISSVTTRQNKTERNHYILRMAIDEMYIPTSIKNLRFAANIIFVILLLLAIVYYVIEYSLFTQLNQNINNIDHSESRLNYIIDVTLRTRQLILYQKGSLKISANTSASWLNTTLTDLRSSATSLKNAQTDLSLKTASLPADQLQSINPSNVELLYESYPNMPNIYYFSIWEAIMEIVVSAYRISTTSLSQITDSNPTCFFVIQNCLNNVLISLKSSTSAILDQSENSKKSNLQTFLYLLIAASLSLFISILFLIPVISRVKKNKQEVLELFTHKNIEKHIDEQLKICRNFVSMRLQQNNEGADQDIDGEDPNINANDKELQNELQNTKYMKRIKKKNKGKKWKKLNTDFGSTLLKFLIFICIIEGYFLATYLLSYQFLNKVQSLTSELSLLISRQPTQSFLLLIQFELIYNNGTSMIEGQNSIQYVSNYQESQYDQEEKLLDQFSQNFNYHSAAYNNDFNSIIYSNVCQYVKYDSVTACQNFNQGILQKGIYSSVIKYWDFLRQVNHDFLESNRTNATIINFLNDPRLQTAQTMEDYYFKMALQVLVTQLEADINSSFNSQFVQSRTIFIVYVIYIAILYALIWRKFVTIMQNELWKTKSMLSVLPTKLCFEIEEIRYFIYANSSNDFLSTKL